MQVPPGGSGTAGHSPLADVETCISVPEGECRMCMCREYRQRRGWRNVDGRRIEGSSGFEKSRAWSGAEGKCTKGRYLYLYPNKLINVKYFGLPP